MDLITVLFIAFGLAMDAFAVSIASGAAIKPLKIHNAFKIALYFGLFQALMPLVGWLTGLALRGFISSIDHWVAFFILLVIGSKMIYESTKLKTEDKKDNPLSTRLLLILSVATSIDALAVGVSIAFLKVFILTPIVAIGMVTFLLSYIGVFVGNKSGHFFENKIEIIGGFILIFIGLKILVEHLTTPPI